MRARTSFAAAAVVFGMVAAACGGAPQLTPDEIIAAFIAKTNDPARTYHSELQGTYKAILATPVSIDDVITGEILWGTTRAVINGTYILIVAAALSPWLHMVESPWAVLIVPLGVLPGLLFSAMSITFASVARAMSQFSYFFNLVINPMFWFGGAFFPFSELPGWAQVVGWFIPLTHVVDMYRDLLQGEPGWGTLGNAAWVAVAAGAFYLVALWSMRRRLVE